MFLHLPEVIHVTSAHVSLASISRMILTRPKEPGTYGTAVYPGRKWKNQWIVMSVITLPLQSVSAARFWEKLPLELSEKENKQCSKLWETQKPLTSGCEIRLILGSPTLFLLFLPPRKVYLIVCCHLVYLNFYFLFIWLSVVALPYTINAIF